MRPPLNEPPHEKTRGAPVYRCPAGGVSGGAGNRTLVRIRFQNHVYVRRLAFSPSPWSGVEPTISGSIS